MLLLKNPSFSLLLVYCSFVFFLSACGGGGGGGGSSSSSSSSSSSTSVVSTVTGLAATGAAIANSTLGIKCSDGNSGVVSQSTTTSATGTYSFTLPSGTVLPCLAQAQIKNTGGTVIDNLHGLAQSVDGSNGVVVNINPITEAIIAAILQTTDVASVFASPTITQLNTLKTTDIATVWSAIKTKMTDAGITHSAITGNPLSQVFSANSTGYDKVLDDLKTKGLTNEHLYKAARNQTAPPSVATGALNDTGADWCSENITTPGTWVNTAVCRTFSWVGNLWGQQQDGFSGRDYQAKGGTLTKVGSGAAGFDYTRIGEGGKPLKIQNGTWSDSGTEAAGTRWDCVRDNVTGFMWEVKRNDSTHLRHMGHRYSWYNTDTAIYATTSGYETPVFIYTDEVNWIQASYSSPTCTGVADVNKCNTQAYVTKVNTEGICGFKDWRLPTIDQLQSISHKGVRGPAIDTTHFPNTKSFSYWSASTYPGNSTYAFMSDFNFGNAYSDNGRGEKRNAFYVRLVRFSN